LMIVGYGKLDICSLTLNEIIFILEHSLSRMCNLGMRPCMFNFSYTMLKLANILLSDLLFIKQMKM
jgi:hypothetical protein